MALKRSLLALVFLLALSAAAGVQAYYLPLQFEPPAPVAGQLTQVRVRVGECDALQVFNPQHREIAIEGNTIRVTVRGTTAFDQTFCIYPDAAFLLDLVPLSAGTYRIELYRFELEGSNVDLMQSADLVVGFAPSISVPSLGTMSISALALMVFVLGLLRARQSIT